MPPIETAEIIGGSLGDLLVQYLQAEPRLRGGFDRDIRTVQKICQK